LETWLLADPQARKQVFGAACGNPFSGDPEARPAPGALKDYIARGAAREHLETKTVYENLAKAARPNELKKACPNSYAPFAEDVDAEIAPIVRF
jgi:hypothetical protein